MLVAIGAAPIRAGNNKATSEALLLSKACAAMSKAAPPKWIAIAQQTGLSIATPAQIELIERNAALTNTAGQAPNDRLDAHVENRLKGYVSLGSVLRRTAGKKLPFVSPDGSLLAVKDRFGEGPSLYGVTAICKIFIPYRATERDARKLAVTIGETDGNRVTKRSGITGGAYQFTATNGKEGAPVGKQPIYLQISGIRGKGSIPPLLQIDIQHRKIETR